MSIKDEIQSADNQANEIINPSNDVSVEKQRPAERYYFSGPLPPPALLEGYDRLLPGSAERILSMAEASLQHQQEMERDALEHDAAEIHRGQIFGLTIGITALLAAVVALAMGSQIVAGVIGGSTVVGLVSVFIVGRLTSLKKEEKQ